MFAESFGKDLECLSLVLKQTNLSRGLTEGAVSSLKTKLRDVLAGFAYPRRNLPSIEPIVLKSFQTKAYKEKGVLTKELPPKSYIGKGYRDKGTAKEPAQDGSPRWQDVAVHVSHVERRINELREELEGLQDANPLIRLNKISELGKQAERFKRTRGSSPNSGDAKTSQRKNSKT